MIIEGKYHLKSLLKKLSPLMAIRKLTMGQILNNLKYRYSPKRPVLNYDPLVLSVHTTSRCNLTCDMCQTHSDKIPANMYHHKGSKDMDFQTFKQFVDKFKNAVTVSLIGTGEPFLNKDFFEMSSYAAFEKKMSVHTVSNGTIIGPKIDDILSSGLQSIEISLNGHNGREYNRTTGQHEKYYTVIYNNILELVKRRNEKKAKLTISLSFILDQQNYSNISQMIEVAERLKVNEITFHNFLPSPVTGFIAEERCLYSDNQDVIKTLSQLSHADYKIKINFPVLLDKSRREKYCRSYFQLIRVDGEGNVGGCAGQLLNLSGNGKFYDDDVWNNPHFRERRMLFLDPGLPELPPCKNCCANHSPYVL